LHAAIRILNRDFGSDNIESNGDENKKQRTTAINRRVGAAINLDFRPDYNNQYYIRPGYIHKFTDDEFTVWPIHFTLMAMTSEIA